jgi:hypothetical protein
MRLAIVLTVAVIGLTVGCSTDDESLGHYYEFTFTDNIRAVIAGDSMHVLMIQTADFTPKYLQAIPFRFTDQIGLRDTLEFKMTVLYGGYSPTPTPKSLVQQFHDSIIVKYDNAVYDRSTGFFKPATPTESTGVQTSPRITYYSIQSVEILQSPDRHLTFESRLIR